MSEDDVAGSLIAALGDEGEYVDDGEFTLDAVKAQAKLRDYQLSDPHGYLLLLVEATWIATRDRGPTSRARIEITTGTTTEVVLDGPTLPAHALGNLFGAALGDLGGVDDPIQARVLQLLGLAANSALALEPRALTIEAVDPRGHPVRATIDVNGVEIEQLRDKKPPEAPEIRLSLRGARLDRDRPAAERELVRDRCRRTSLEVRVDGARVSSGPAGEIDRKRTPVLLDGREIGVAGFTSEFGIGKARIVNRGVEVESLRLHGPDGLLAVVEVDLPMDLSRSQLQRGEEFQAVEAAIEAAAGGLQTSGRVNWRAVQTGDGPMIVVLALLGLGFMGLLWASFTVLTMLFELE